MACELIAPGATLDYTMEWANVLGDRTISSSTWSIYPTGPTLSGNANTTDTATTKIAGCTLGQVYRLTNEVVTSGGTTEEQSIILRCEKR
jgi:hypothetical protein